MSTEPSPRVAIMDCRLERLPDTAIVEFVAYPSAARNPQAAAWSAAPGAVVKATDGSACRLHFAPGRWLLPQPDSELELLLGAALAAGFGARIDVEGKWVALSLAGPDARRVLASTIDIAAVLSNRTCAAVTLFDCPAVVMRDADRYRVWVAASYAESFAAAIGRLTR